MLQSSLEPFAEASCVIDIREGDTVLNSTCEGDVEKFCPHGSRVYLGSNQTRGHSDLAYIEVCDADSPHAVMIEFNRREIQQGRSSTTKNAFQNR